MATIDVHEDFSVHRLNTAGLEKADQLAEIFSTAMKALDLPEGRERSLVRTKMQEASFWAKRAIALRPEYQQKG